MNAVAISNNHMVHLHWLVESKIVHCLGFNVIRHDAETNTKKALPAMVGFPAEAVGGQSSDKRLPQAMLRKGDCYSLEDRKKGSWLCPTYRLRINSTNRFSP
jgi:hypothetical protein